VKAPAPRLRPATALKYTLLPGIIPWLKDVVFSGFSTLTLYVAMIYVMLRLIPKGHAVLRPNAQGRYSLRQVIAVAYSNLNFQWRYLDQILMFFVVLTGIVLSWFFLLALVAYLLVNPALAAGGPLSFFVTQHPEKDIAFMMMDRMLGIPGIFNSDIITNTAKFGPSPSPFQQGMLALFSFYSYGMLIIALVFMLYFIFNVVLESAMTGKPFGKHFENVFIPLRLVAAFGLLIPLSSFHGLNSAQTLTLYIGKMGSSMATNAWTVYNQQIDNPMGLSNFELVSRPTAPPVDDLVKTLYLARTCAYLEERPQILKNIMQIRSGTPPRPTANLDTITPAEAQALEKYYINPYIIRGSSARSLVEGGGEYNDDNLADDNMFVISREFDYDVTNAFNAALANSENKDIKIILGRKATQSEMGTYPADIVPVCGEVVVPVNGTDRVSKIVAEGHFYAVLNLLYGIERKRNVQGGTLVSSEINDLNEVTAWKMYQNKSEEGQKFAASEPSRTSQDNDDNREVCLRSTYDGLFRSLEVDLNRNNFFDTSFDTQIGPNGQLVEGDLIGPCHTPYANTSFYQKLIDEYQIIFTHASMAAYEYLTSYAEEQYARDCNFECQNDHETCTRMKALCQKKSTSFPAHAQVYPIFYEDLGEPNPLARDANSKDELLRYGWAGAGIWYKSISEFNGLLMSATQAVPVVSKLPMAIERVISTSEATKTDIESGGFCERIRPSTSGSAAQGQATTLAADSSKAQIYYDLCKNVIDNKNVRATGSEQGELSNFVLMVIDQLFGTKYLFSFRDNAGVHPIAQLSALGRALIDKAIRNLSIAMGGAAFGGLFSLFGITNDMKDLAGAGSGVQQLSKALTTFAMIGLSAGVLLHYVLPFLPFMYFFFAAGRWVKTIFEALCGMPLWALAHLSMEGQGFAGKAASGGYFLLLEIFLRPIITVFCLIAAMSTFGAMAYVLNMMWGVVTANLVGFDPAMKMSNNPTDFMYYRSRLDQFFFTITYVIIMYMMAVSSFKLIDIIPDNIMRWLSDTKTFGGSDNADDLVDNSTNMVAIPTYMYSQRIMGAASDVVFSTTNAPGSLAAALSQQGGRQQGQGGAPTPPQGPATPPPAQGPSTGQQPGGPQGPQTPSGGQG
jgi:hypothetical protein